MARFLVLLLSLLPITFYAQSIEAINSNGEALAFLKKVHPGFEEKKPDAEYKHLRDSLFPVLKRVNYYEKADFDNNGYTDLLFNGCSWCCDGREYSESLPLVILSFGNDSFRIKDLSCRKYTTYLAARTVQAGGRPMIEIACAGHESASSESLVNPIERVDTLLYAFDEFIENTQPAHHSIENISFSRFCYGNAFNDSCSFMLTFSPDTTQLTRQVSTNWNTVIKKYVAGTDTACWNQMTGLLNRMNFPGLKDYYGAGGTHLPMGFLSITYDNGKVSHIPDYGMLGTYALMAIYEICYKTALTFAGKLVSNESGLLGPAW
jgi:hypothetical protein